MNMAGFMSGLDVIRCGFCDCLGFLLGVVHTWIRTKLGGQFTCDKDELIQFPERPDPNFFIY